MSESWFILIYLEIYFSAESNNGVHVSPKS